MALLCRFAADVCTQLGKKITPYENGWASEYPYNIELKTVPIKIIEVPEIIEELPDIGDLIRASIVLISLWGTRVAIYNQYFYAARCLVSASLKVKKVLSEQDIHSQMDPVHLEGLVSGFLGEGEYWLCKIMQKEPEWVEISKDFYEKHDANNIKSIILEHGYNVKEEDYAKFEFCLNLYPILADCFADALKLYKEALELCKNEKDLEIIKNRMKEIKKLASKNPYQLPRPQPIL